MPTTLTPTGGGRLLAAPAFRLWYASRTVSLIGTTATAVALPLLVHRASGSAVLTASVAGLAVAPYLLFGLFAGALADRVSRRALMIGADLLAAAALATVPAAWWAGALTVWHALAVAAAVATCFVFFDGAAFGALPAIVGKERLASANALVWSTATAVGVVVPALAGLVSTAVDPVAVLAADAVTYLLSALLLRGVRADLRPRREPGRTRLRADIAEGLRHVWSRPVIRHLTLTGFVLSACAGGVAGLLIVHAGEVLRLGADDRRIGLLYSAGAVGALLASVLLARLSKRLGAGRLSIAGYAAAALTLPALALNEWFAAALALWVLWDFAFTTAVANGITIRQVLTPDALQGRVNTTGRMIAWGGTPFGALSAGLLTEYAGVRVAYLALALPIAAGAVLLARSPVRRHA